jgi:hypothetical protein
MPALVLCLVACTRAPRDSCPDSLTLIVGTRQLNPNRTVEVNYGLMSLELDSGVSLEASVERDGSVFEKMQATGQDLSFAYSGCPLNSWFTTDALSAGPLHIKINAVCAGHDIKTFDDTQYAYDTIPVGNHIPRSCEQLVLLNDEASLFDCNGIVIDANGIVQDSRPSGTSRVANNVRWTLQNGILFRENESDSISSTTFSFDSPPSENIVRLSWVVAEDFTISFTDRRTLIAMVSPDGGLLSADFDGGSYQRPSDSNAHWYPYYPCAVASNRTERAVAYCYSSGITKFDLNYTPEPELIICSIAELRLGACHATTGMLIRQEELPPHRVLIQRHRELFWVDLLNPETETPAYSLRGREQPDEGTTSTQGAFSSVLFGYAGYFSAGVTPRILVPILPDWTPSAFLPLTREQLINGSESELPIYRFNHHASSRIVWGNDAVSPNSGTYWAPLPQ